MKNLGNILKQAQNMQSRMAEIQEELQDLEIEGQAGAGLVRVTVNGKGEMRSLQLDPAVVDKDEVSVLEDLIVAAVNDARGKAETVSREKMAALTEGLPLPPGLKLPF
ncbi:MAG: YbaB/EbfC family nucleoid-associated protein [Alphaproteobacteria bacterium]|nr:YbaB/EbfC family nucleoid-associated protein [Alphaproteobacteria bacterium]MCB9928864.1 YbaB/EbfC family nucleoid-associated protein [Alphaproteobacteria bacterium]